MNPTTTEAPRQTNSEAEPRPKGGAGVGYTFDPTPQEIRRRTDLSDGAKILFAFLLSDPGFRGGDRISPASNVIIARECGCSESSLPRKFKELEKAGLIRRETKAVGPKRRERTGIRNTWKPAEIGLQNVGTGTPKVVGDRPTHSGRIKEPETKEQEKEYATTQHPKSNASSSDPSRGGVLRVAGSLSFEGRPEEPPSADSEANDTSEVAKLIEDARRLRAEPDSVRALVRKHRLEVVQTATRYAIANAKETWGWVVTVAKAWADEGIPDYAQHLRPELHLADPAAVESQRLAAREKGIRAYPAECLADPHATEWDKAIARDQLRQEAKEPATAPEKAPESPQEAPRAVETPIPSSEATESLVGDPGGHGEEGQRREAMTVKADPVEKIAPPAKAQPDPEAQAEADRRRREERAEAERRQKATVEARERRIKREEAERARKERETIANCRAVLANPNARPGQRQMAEATLRARGLDPAPVEAPKPKPVPVVEPAALELDHVEPIGPSLPPDCRPSPEDELAMLAVFGRASINAEAPESVAVG